MTRRTEGFGERMQVVSVGWLVMFAGSSCDMYMVPIGSTPFKTIPIAPVLSEVNIADCLNLL